LVRVVRCGGIAKETGALDGLDLGDVGQPSTTAKTEVGHSGLSFREEHAVIAGLSDLSIRIILLSQHGEPRRQVGHQQAGAEVIIRWQSSGQINLWLDLLLLHLLSFAKPHE
jgi:hypothetical protein